MATWLTQEDCFKTDERDNVLHIKYPSEIIKSLKEARLAKNITQRELSRRSGYATNQISKWEQGVHQPSITAVANIANALGFNIVLEEKGERYGKEMDTVGKGQDGEERNSGLAPCRDENTER